MTADTPDINERYIRRMTRSDHLAICQAAYIDREIGLCHARTKGHFTRYYEYTARHVNFTENASSILAAGRQVIDAEQQAAAEEQIYQVVDAAARTIEAATLAAEALCRDHAITGAAKFVQPPLHIRARVTSHICAQYLDVIEKVDRLLALFDSLRIHGAMNSKEHADRLAEACSVLMTIPRGAETRVQQLRRQSRVMVRVTEDPTQASSEPPQVHAPKLRIAGAGENTIPVIAAAANCEAVVSSSPVEVEESPSDATVTPGGVDTESPAALDSATPLPFGQTSDTTTVDDASATAGPHMVPMPSVLARKPRARHAEDRGSASDSIDVTNAGA